MLARVFVLTSLVAAAACGSKAPPAAPAPGGSGPAPAASTSFELDGAPWTIAVEAVVTGDGDFDRTITTPAFELSVMPWPRSDAFVQTSAQQLEGTRDAEVLHQADAGPYAFELVVVTEGKIDGGALVPDPDGGDGAMCSFKLAAGEDWKPVLAACASLARGH